jgi:hypothetical protein
VGKKKKDKDISQGRGQKIALLGLAGWCLLFPNINIRIITSIQVA